ncbi:MAG: ADP-forming succinate--CoA ligase subunit beta [Gammaproteobacteria bacterium]|nr:MAG: ADP-forming succinate--CoA ligase subunit beta [Gammaproteobacteria bacterium]
MNLHEYQGKNLFRLYGIPVPDGEPVTSASEVEEVAKSVSAGPWVVKAQVYAGGRGKAGGVKLLDNIEQVKPFAESLLGSRLVTHQSGPDGQPVNTLLVEAPSDIDRELYLACVVDRASERMVFMASQAGGMDIEQVAAETPEKILKTAVHPAAGLQGYQCRDLAFAMGLDVKQARQLTAIMSGLYKLMLDKDLSLVEINPLVVTADGDLLALDAKVNIDDNALYRHKDLADMRDESQEDERELRAQELQLNYVALDGNIGCMVNGAGLAMATMDLIKLCGGEPANFLDVGGGVTAQRVAEAFKLILSDDKVKAVLVNIFGGIVRCNLIAEGIITAVKEVDIKVPVIVRLEGTHAEQGRKMLAESGLAITAADDLTRAAELAVSLANGGGAA